MLVYTPQSCDGIVTYVDDQVLRDKYGGKALGLMKVSEGTRFGWMVPRFFALPAKATFAPGPVSVVNLCRLNKYAVRSGASVSMPGAMATVLNVSLSDIQDAVVKVWESYNSAPCKAYREALGVGDVGTGVVIQEMVRNPQISGVMFTHDPTTFDKFSPLSPLIMYVDGLGDKLVDGTVNPQTMDMSHNNYRVLHKAATRLFELYGHSDIEWSIDDADRLNLLQLRPMAVPKKVDFAAPDNVGELAVYGKPIGAASSAVAYLRRPDEHWRAGDAIYVENFAPEVYEKMLKSSAVVCATGDKLCHAAIVAMTIGIPVVSYISDHEISEVNIVGTKVFIDGVGGGIFRTIPDVVYEVSVPTLSMIPAPEKYRKISTVYRDGYDSSCRTFCSSSLLARFYWMMSEGGRSNPEFEDAVCEIAHVIASYIYIATMGEARYVSVVGSNDVKALREAGFPFQYMKLARCEFQELCPNPTSAAQAAEFLRMSQRAHLHYSATKVSISGPRWAHISATVADYVEGLTSPEIFLDRAFNLQHNNSSVFTKCPWMRFSKAALTTQLDARSKGGFNEVAMVTNLPNYCRNYVSSWSTILTQLEQDAINGVPTALSALAQTEGTAQ